MANKVVTVEDGKLLGISGTNGQVLTWNGTTSEAEFAAPSPSAEVSFAQEYFVALNGNDTTGNGSLSAPYATVAKAVETANAVSGAAFLKINVAAGTYSGSFSITRPNILIEGAGINPEERVTAIAGTVTVDSTAASSTFNEQVGLAGLFIQSSTTNPAVRFTGTGAETLSIDGCLLTVTNATANVIWCDSTAASRSITILRNTNVLHQSTTASASVAKFEYGDIRFDSVRLFTSGSGSTGYGVELLNSATLFADRIQIDVTTTAAAVFGSGTSATQKVLLSNASITNRGNNANAHALSVTNGAVLSGNIAVYAWQVLLTVLNASAKAINGTLGASGVYYGALSFGPNASGVINSSIASGVTLLALSEKLGNANAASLTLDSALGAASGGTGLGAPVAGDVGKVIKAKADGTYELGSVAGVGTVTSVSGGTGTSGLTITPTPDPITESGSLTIPAPDVFAFDTTPASVADAPGEMSWSDTEGTLDLILKGGNVNAYVGEQLYQRAANDDSVTLTKGMVVYVYGSTGTRVSVKRATADADSTSATILGVVAESIAVSGTGFILMSGLMKDLTILPTASFTDGSPVYLSPTTPGGITQTKPTAPQHLVLVGYVAKTSNGAAGELLVHPQNGYELGELHDVYINSPTSGQILVYDGAVGQTRWENASLGSSNGVAVTAGAGSLSVGLDAASSPTLTGLTLSGLTASQYVKTDASKALTTVATIPASDVTAIPYDLPAEVAGTPPVSTAVVNFKAVRAFTLASSGHQGGAVTFPGSSVVLSVRKNGTEVGTLTYGTSSFSASVTQTSFAAGDLLTVVTPSSVSTLDTPYFTLAMTLG